MTGVLETVIGPVPQVSPELTIFDHLGSVKTRLGLGRMQYIVAPGLYGVGEPGRLSKILVTANYKLSFDSLRKHLQGRDVWLLVLDTNGINVWCAAGKGTFGTDELAARLNESGLDRLVDHRVVILPQLAGPGVAAHMVPKATGFSVHYGPVLAADLPAYLDAGEHCSATMRIKKFPLSERLLLAPLELLIALKGSLPFFVALLLLLGFAPGDGYVSNVINNGRLGAYAYLAAIVAGTMLTPLLLPWLPGRAFSVKGATAGLLAAAVLLYFAPYSHWLHNGGAFLLIVVLSSYWGMEFTGASTYTSLSGVKKEMRTAVPLQIAGGVAGVGCWIVASFF